MESEMFKPKTMNSMGAGNSSNPSVPPPPPPPPMMDMKAKPKYVRKVRTEEEKFQDEAKYVGQMYTTDLYKEYNPISDRLAADEADFKAFIERVRDEDSLFDTEKKLTPDKVKQVMKLILYWDSLQIPKLDVPELVRGDSVSGLASVLRYSKFDKLAEMLYQKSAKVGNPGPMSEGADERAEEYEQLKGQKLFFSRFVSTSTDPTNNFFTSKNVHYHLKNVNVGLGRDLGGNNQSEAEVTFPVGTCIVVDDVKEHVEIDGKTHREKLVIDIDAHFSEDFSRTEMIRGRAVDMLGKID